jgi:hypothetical protein
LNNYLKIISKKEFFLKPKFEKIENKLIENSNETVYLKIKEINASWMEVNYFISFFLTLIQ